MPFKIRDIRKEKSLSQEELARKAGVSRATLSALETGALRVTTTDTLIKLADAMGVKVSDIFFNDQV